MCDISVVDTILNTDIERKELLEEEKRLADDDSPAAAARIAALYNRLIEINAFEAEAKARTVILIKLGVELKNLDKIILKIFVAKRNYVN